MLTWHRYQRCMFSWSFRWLWVQCLAVSAGLFLLAHMAVPGAADLSTVSGTVESVGAISRKGLGGYWELNVRADSGDADRVLVRRDAVSEADMRSLIGHPVTAGVNWSAEAVRFAIPEDPAHLGQTIEAAALASGRMWSGMAAVALALGIFLGLVRLILSLRRTQDQ